MEQNNEVIDLSYENKFTALLDKYKQIKPKEKPKHKYEFIELCTELEPIYGKQIWALVRRIGFTEYKIRKAHEVVSKTPNIKNKMAYLIGVIKKMPY